MVGKIVGYKPKVKKFLSYVFVMYLISMAAIAVGMLLETMILQYFYPADKTPFSSPLFIAIGCGVVHPLLNLPVITILYRYGFTKTEIAVESIGFVHIYAYLVEDIIRAFVSPSQLFVHETFEGFEAYSRVWWYSDSFLIIYGICLTLILCLLYVKIKRAVVKIYNKATQP